ncbi:MAG: sensor histidine kinase [Bacteroidota bacterium]
MKYYFLIIFTISGQLLFGQKLELLELLNKNLSLAKSDSARVDILVDLGWEWLFADILKSQHYATEADSILAVIEYPRGRGNCAVLKGSIEKNKENCSSAEQYYREALEIRQSLNDKAGVASCYNNIGRCLKSRGKFKEAIHLFEKGVATLEEASIVKTRASLQNNLAECHIRLGQFQKALQVLNESLQLSTNTDDISAKASSLLNLGLAHENLGNYIQARRYYQKSIPLYERINARHQVTKCYINLGNLELKANNFPAALEALQTAQLDLASTSAGEQTRFSQNLAAVYLHFEQWEKAQPLLFDNLEFFTQQKDINNVAETKYNLGKALFEQGKYEDALRFYQEVEELPDSIISRREIHPNLIHNISLTHAKLENFEQAYEYENLATVLNDSLYQQRARQITAERNYMESQKQNQILRKNKQLQQTIIASLILGGLALSVIAFLAFVNYRNQQQKALAEKSEQISRQKLLDLVQKQDLITAYARIEGQETERTKIAQYLHDSVGGILSTVKMYFRAFTTPEMLSNEEKAQQFKLANELLDKAAEEVRNVSHELEEVTLKRYGVEAQLRSMADTLRQSKQLAVNVIVKGIKKQLNGVTGVKVYRIIQELVNNTIKHAKAQKVVIQLLGDKQGSLNIIVEDDGKGFDVKKAEAEGGMGLLSIKSRLHDLSGTLQIDSSEKAGTTVIIDIPLSA